MPRPHVFLWQSSNDRWYFHKKAGNGKIVGDSGQGYKEKRYAKVAIKREYPGLPIVEVDDL